MFNRSVTAAIIERLPVTLSLAGLALVFALVMGVLAGVVAAVHHNRWPDQVVMTLALFGLSVPDFWLGIMLILLFAVKLGSFPTGGYVPFTEDPVGWAGTIIMPALTLAIIQVGFVARMTRASMLEILGQDFIRTADAKGSEARRDYAPSRASQCVDPYPHSRRRSSRARCSAARSSSSRCSRFPASAA